MNPEQFVDRFSNHLKNVVTRAMTLATSLENSTVSPVHLLFTIAEEAGSIASEVLLKSSFDKNVVYAFLASGPKANIISNNQTATAIIPSLSKTSKQALEKAMLISYERNHIHVGTEHLLFGIMNTKDPETEAIIQTLKINAKRINEELENIFQSTSKFPNIDEVSGVMEQMQNIIEQEAPPLPPMANPGVKNKLSALNVFTTNLTDKNLQKNIDPVIGREKEIERLINILCRRNKNNPVLIGEPGVGKTAIVEGLAKKIAAGDVPDILKRKKILSLDLTLMLAGTIYRGEFESRLKQIIDEISKMPDGILFIDELHNIIGAGSSQGAMDAANILKPALARGNLRCIGATTIDEYKKHIASDPALERRFQAIEIEEPSKKETIEILKGIKKYYENFHHTIISDDTIETAVNLSLRYIHDNFLPDKAIDLIDEACASVKVKQKMSPDENKRQIILDELENLQNQKEEAIKIEKFENALKIKKQIEDAQKKLMQTEKEIKNNKLISKKKVTVKDIAHILENRLHIKQAVILSNEWEELDKLPERLNQSIIGQKTTIDNLVKTLKQSYLGLKTGKKPLASFLFVGPSGVGKTELAKVLAKELYHDEKALIKLDMGEFSEQHGISKLLGSPAGYIGYKDRNRFLDEIKKRPYSVVLFDEFDKAHKDIHKILMQILDEGELTDSSGKKIHFNHSIVVLTSNIGSEYFKSQGIGFERHSSTPAPEHSSTENGELNKKIISKLKEEFGSALITRIDSICVFNPLSREALEKIIEQKINILSNQLFESRQFCLKSDKNSTASLLAQINTDAGAREIERKIQQVVQDLVIEIIKQKQAKRTYTLTSVGGEYKLV